MHRVMLALSSQQLLGGSLQRDAAVLLAVMTSVGLGLTRAVRRSRRRCSRLCVEPYRADRADAEAVRRMIESLHLILRRPWWARLPCGQPSISLEVHSSDGPAATRGWFAVSVPAGTEASVEAVLRSAYPNCRLRTLDGPFHSPPIVFGLRKRHLFILRAKMLERFEQQRGLPVDGLLTAMGSCPGSSLVQLVLTPAPDLYRALARQLHAGRQARAQGGDGGAPRRPTLADEAELRGGMDLVHVPLFALELRVAAASTSACRLIASELQVGAAENRLVARRARTSRGTAGRVAKRVQRGEPAPLRSPWRRIFAPSEIACLWHLPSCEYSTVPILRGGVPVAPAPPGVHRPSAGPGVLSDEYGPVSIEPKLRRQNTAVPGTVEQGKTSYLVATIAEDLERERCALILFDPKGDAADAAISLVDPSRTCTVLDLARPTCGFNPLAVDAPADVIADYVVAALRNLFSDADIRASSDRYLRNAVIAVLAYDRRCTLWDAARLLSVGEEGYAFRKRVAAAVRSLPEFSEISAFFTAEIGAQLADARSMTTAKLDAPVNKLARLLNSPSIKRVLLNESLLVDFDRVIAGGEVLVVKGALGVMGAGNTSVLMQLLVGMLDAALARQQDLVAAEQRVAVALKVDEAPLVLNRGFAETMALKRSAGLETVACWQTDAQWSDRGGARTARRPVRPPRVFRDGLGERRAGGGPADHERVLRQRAAGYRQPLCPGPPGRPAAPPQAPCDRELDHQPRGARRRSWDGRSRCAWTGRGSRCTPPASTPAAPGTRPTSASATGTAPPPSPPHRPSCLALGEEILEPATPAQSSPTSSPPGHEGLREPAFPEKAAASFRELLDIDRAQRVRWGHGGSVRRDFEPEPLDIEMLVLTSALGHLLSTQIHRWFNPTRSPSTTQRRLKRLSDAGLVERLQFHRSDGGGAPMCYRLSEEGRDLLISLGAAEHSTETDPESLRGLTALPRDPTRARRVLRRIRREIHVAGWALALMASGELANTDVRGREESALDPPGLRTGAGRGSYGPDELRLPGGRVPHDFLSSRGCAEGSPAARRPEVERFETVRPDAIVRASGTDILVELDDRLPSGADAAKLERYDHFLTGWSLHTRRYGDGGEASAEVVFVCRDRDRARACARAADQVLCAARAYAGEYPFDWDYTGRRRVCFVAERDIHEGGRLAYGVPPLPPRCAHTPPAVTDGPRRPRS